MKATQKLEQEHRTIYRVAEACDVFAEMVENGTIVPPGVLQKLVEVMRAYGERYHQEQEQWLFRMLKSKGVSPGSCPIAVLTHEDHKLEMLVDELGNAVKAYAKSAGIVNGTLVSTLRSLAELYSDQIWKEDYLLLPMAEKILSDYDWEVLAESLRMVDSERGPAARKALADFSAGIKSCPECNLSHEPRVA